MDDDARDSAFPNSWIPVTERLPAESQRVRFSNDLGAWSGQFVDDDFWQDEGGDDAVVIRGVTRWMLQADE